MFDSLSSKLQNAFKNLRGLGKISEANVGEALREVRLALLEADVNFKVARDFIERVKVKALGQEVVQSIQPGQQIIKIIYDELVDLLGFRPDPEEEILFADRLRPAGIVLETHEDLQPVRPVGIGSVVVAPQLCEDHVDLGMGADQLSYYRGVLAGFAERDPHREEAA